MDCSEAIANLITKIYCECACFVTDYCRCERDKAGHADRMKYDILALAELVDKARKQHPEWEWEEAGTNYE